MNDSESTLQESGELFGQLYVAKDVHVLYKRQEIKIVHKDETKRVHLMVLWPPLNEVDSIDSRCRTPAG
jgi:hypothetical protein